MTIPVIYRLTIDIEGLSCYYEMEFSADSEADAKAKAEERIAFIEKFLASKGENRIVSSNLAPYNA